MLSFLKRGRPREPLPPPRLASYVPTISFDGLQTGVDNLRHDVYLSPRFTEQVRRHLTEAIARHGGMEGILDEEAAVSARRSLYLGTCPPGSAPDRARPESDFKAMLSELLLAALNRAKAEDNPAIELLARVAVIKLLRSELHIQFNHLLERCRVLMKSYEGVREARALEFRERVAEFQVAKKTILRKVGQELFQILRQTEIESLARMRRSLFGDKIAAGHDLVLNRLLFSEDGRDEYLNAEHYVMFGNFQRDPDRFPHARDAAAGFLRSLGLGKIADDDRAIDGWLNVPSNAQELVGGGKAEDSEAMAKARKARLALWVSILEEQRMLDLVVAAYEAVPLLPEYSPRINAQQLKHALISRPEWERVETLISEHGKLSPDSLYAAVGRVSACRGAERSKVAARFLRDLMRYHRDLRRMEVFNLAADSVNLISNEKLRELSRVNGLLYEFLRPEEQPQTGEERVAHHVILKADVRDSTRLTRTLMERGLNPASYFSLNFYDPVNKLLPKYGATKVFIEGDALILALFEREGEAGFAVSRASALAREIIGIVQGYNQKSHAAGLPSLELGIGISYQDSAPLYLMDGSDRVMISDALNESDRLSSCSKCARRVLAGIETPFSVFAFQTVSEADADENPDEFLMPYNVAGIRMNEAAFQKLQLEISLEPVMLELPGLWGQEQHQLYRGLVSVGNGIFQPLVVRASRTPVVDPRTFARKGWSQRNYYEVCTNEAVYSSLEKEKAAGAAATAGSVTPRKLPS
jgi:class 3 adenylate cyclase